MRKYIIILLVLIAVSDTVYGAEINMPYERGILLYENKSGTIIYEQRSDEVFFPASTTKIMTGLVVLDKMDLNDKITVGKEIELISGDSSTAKLEEGEILSVNDLLYALLLPSGNDAACTLAVNVARKEGVDNSIQESMDYFVSLMNNRAKTLGAYNTNFLNPHGLHDIDHYSTPRDILLITKEFLKREKAREIVSCAQYEIVTNKATHKWANSNLFLHKSLDDFAFIDQKGPNEFYNGSVTGVKTGFTDAAGRCLVFSATAGNMDLIGLLYNSSYPEIWEEGSQLIEYANTNYDYTTLATSGQVIEDIHIHVLFGKGYSTKAYVEHDFKVLLDKRKELSSEIEYDSSKIVSREDGTYKLVEDIEKGEVIAEMKFYSDDNLLGQCNLVSSEELFVINQRIILFIMGICTIVFVLYIKMRINKKYK